MLEKWGKDFMDHTIITGDSAGIIMVLGITLKYSPEYIGKLYLDTGKLNKHGLLSKNGFKNLEDCCLRNLLENDDALKTLNNRCYIGYIHIILYVCVLYICILYIHFVYMLCIS